MRILAFAFAALLPVAAIGQTAMDGSLKALPPNKVDALKNVLLQATSDPFAVQFLHLRVGKTGAVCGTFNAKNLYGAYTGFRSFILAPDGKSMNVDPAGPYERLVASAASHSAEELNRQIEAKKKQIEFLKSAQTHCE
jgi:hypothetical protein